MATMTVQKLRALLDCLPDDAEVCYSDPNFGGEYCNKPEDWYFKIEGGKLLIAFPFETPVD